MDLIIFRLVRYTVLDPGDVPPVSITTTETSATTTTPTTIGSSASSVALTTKKSKSVSIPMVAGIAAAIGVVAIVILFLLCRRMRRVHAAIQAPDVSVIIAFSVDIPHSQNRTRLIIAPPLLLR
jgi:hypothetical protein